MRDIAIYYCSKGTASGLQEHPAQKMLVVADPLDASSWFVGTPSEFVDTYWDSLSWEFRSRRSTARELDVSQIRDLIEDMEWHDPSRTTGKAHFMFGLRVKKRTRGAEEPQTQTQTDSTSNKRQKVTDDEKMHELKETKDQELDCYLGNSSTSTLVDQKTEKPYGSIFHKWHLRNQSYEVVYKQRNIAVSNDQVNASDAADCVHRIEKNAQIFLFARQAFKIMMKTERSEADRAMLASVQLQITELLDI